MEISPGYKRTEIGVLPEQWDTLPFHEVFRKSPAKNFQVQTTEYQVSGSFPVIDQGQESVVGYSDRSDRVFRIPQGGVVVFGDHTCIVKHVRHDFIVGADGTQILSAREGQMAAFHALALSMRPVESTGYNRHFKFLKERIFQAPPLPEQKAIVEALSDTDASIAALSRLIAKKRDLRQGAMQRLLTGQTRLPGFTALWHEQRLGDLGRTYGGLTGKTKADFGNGTARYVTFMGVIAESTVDPSSFDSVHIGPAEKQNTVLCGDILFNGSSETPEDVALCSFVDLKASNLYLNSFCFGFRTNNVRKFDGKFLVYLFRSKFGRKLVRELAQGSTRYNVSKKSLMNVRILIPDLQEQAAIVATLSNFDSEITGLCARLEKTRALKQAMMQALLTGRVRLSAGGDAAPRTKEAAHA